MTEINVEPFEIDITDRNGVLLRADVYLPRDADGPVPVLLAASPYQKSLRRLPASAMFAFVEYGPMQLYLDQGYAYVILDLPGSGRSEGNWDPVARSEGEAIYDAIEHIAAEPWSNGAVGMIGQSYFCWSQWNAARTRPPHLKTIVPYDGATDMYRDWMYQGGIPSQGFLGSWLIGSVMLQHQAEGHDVRGGNRHQVLPEILAHTLEDEWHRRRSPFWELDQVDIPVFSIGVWGKGTLHLRGNVRGYERVRGPKRLLITHPDSFKGAQLLFADEAFHREEILPWYDHHLKGIDNGVMDKAPVRFFVNGRDAYDGAEQWPPAGAAAAEFYLDAAKSGAVDSLNDGSLTETPPDSPDKSTRWSYPQDAWTAGITTFKNGMPNHTAAITTYTTAALTEDREFTGNGMVVLHASSDQRDMDVMVRVMVLPAAGRPGAPRKVTQGWLRASHRAEDPALTEPLRPFHRHDAEQPLTPGEIYELRVELLPMSFRVKAGERICLWVTNNDSTMIDQPMTHWYGQKVGTDTYHHNRDHRSRLVLPEMPVQPA